MNSSGITYSLCLLRDPLSTLKPKKQIRRNAHVSLENNVIYIRICGRRDKSGEHQFTVKESSVAIYYNIKYPEYSFTYDRTSHYGTLETNSIHVDRTPLFIPDLPALCMCP